MEYPTRKTTVKVIAAFVVVCTLLAWATLSWAASIDPLAGLGIWVLRFILYCFVIALIPWTAMCIVAITIRHMELRSNCARINNAGSAPN